MKPSEVKATIELDRTHCRCCGKESVSDHIRMVCGNCLPYARSSCKHKLKEETK